MIFYDVTLTAGAQRSFRTHDSAQLEPKAVAIFSRMFAAGGDSFKLPIPFSGFGHITLQFTTEPPYPPLATFWIGRTPLTTSVLLAAGVAPEHEAGAIKAVQSMLLQIFRNTPIEPGFDLGAVKERPLIASHVMPVDAAFYSDLGIVGDMETCLMAAWLQEKKAGRL